MRRIKRQSENGVLRKDAKGDEGISQTREKNQTEILDIWLIYISQCALNAKATCILYLHT